MATIKQKRAVERLIENHGNVSRSMLEVGYSPQTAKNPSNLTNSIGFKELCEESGLTEMFLLKALVKDIKGKPKNRKPELELGFKVIGRLKDNEVQKEKTLVVVVTGQTAQRYAGTNTNEITSNG